MGFDVSELSYLLGPRPEPGHARARMEIVASGGMIGISVPDIHLTWDDRLCTASYEDEGIAWTGTGSSEAAALLALLADRSGYKAIVTHKEPAADA